MANGRSNGVHAEREPDAEPAVDADDQGSVRAGPDPITAAYVDTARTLVRAGFDVLELHMAHNYLISSSSPRDSNAARTGGAVAREPARLARQVARAVREEVGGEAAVTAKVSVGDGFRGGVTTDEGLEFPAAGGRRPPRRAADQGGASLMNPMTSSAATSR